MMMSSSMAAIPPVSQAIRNLQDDDTNDILMVVVKGLPIKIDSMHNQCHATFMFVKQDNGMRPLPPRKPISSITSMTWMMSSSPVLSYATRHLPSYIPAWHLLPNKVPGTNCAAQWGETKGIHCYPKEISYCKHCMDINHEFGKKCDIFLEK
jgi:hypothetical protein